MKNILVKFYISQQFNPSFFGIFINPFYFARKALYAAMRELAPNIKGKTLDIGCGVKPYQSLCRSSSYIGLELDSKENRDKKLADFFYDGKAFPFEKNSFDSAIANQVLEHVFEPEVFLEEIHRVLVPGGLLLVTVPFVWAEHEQPQDYARYTSFGIRYLLEKSGFKIIKQSKLCNRIDFIFQIFTSNLLNKIQTNNNTLNLLLCAAIISPFTLIGAILCVFSPKSEDWYLDNVLLVEKR